MNVSLAVAIVSSLCRHRAAVTHVVHACRAARWCPSSSGRMSAVGPKSPRSCGLFFGQSDEYVTSGAKWGAFSGTPRMLAFASSAQPLADTGVMQGARIVDVPRRPVAALEDVI